MNKNLYDTLEEATRRLYQTIVMYDGEPYYVLTICNHKNDGIYRIYLWPIQINQNTAKGNGTYPPIGEWLHFSNEEGNGLDKWMSEHPTTPLVRKMANSPAFNKFRPFPLGMLNSERDALYLARGPERRTQQGLQVNMVDYWSCGVTKQPDRDGTKYRGTLFGPEFYDCVKGTHPDAQECLEKMFDPKYEARNSVAFHRNFAFVRGPLDTFFLQYKTDVVGFVPKSTRPQVELGKKFAHLRESVEETKQFTNITVRN